MRRTLNLRPLPALYLAQFLSAFVDNMILFIVLAILQQYTYPDYYLPLVQSLFLASYIVLSPWVGRFADRHAKARVLMVGNFIKLCGVGLLFAHCDPALSYAVVGVGAVVYSPAKYGILPLLTKGEDALLKANSGLESYTILAILTGSVAGGFLADISAMVGLSVCAVLYILSMVINIFIPLDPGNRAIDYRYAVKEFCGDTTALLKMPQSHYSLIGTGSFWLSSAVLRMLIFAWAPVALGIADLTTISFIAAASGVGVAFGALAAPRFASIATYWKTARFGLGMGLGILSFVFVGNIYLTVFMLLLIGFLGGAYIVPMNAALQQAGHNVVGAGKTIAVQNFVENTFMFAGVGAYTLAVKTGVPTNISLASTGLCLLLFVAYLYSYSYRIKGNRTQS